jgi:hypothetical protein
MRIMTPGPLALGIARPRRKTTPRSYSLRILMALNRKKTTSTKTIIGVKAIIILLIGV